MSPHGQQPEHQTTGPEVVETPSAADLAWLRHAIALAATVDERDVAPNPRVGAIIVGADGRELARGAHREYGGSHAEVGAIDLARSSGASMSGATLYVSLEPCCHHGKTPPCCDAIIKAGITRVVAAQRDPNPLVAGGGAKTLCDAGIQVIIDALPGPAKAINIAFTRFHETGRPLVLAKWAMSVDGHIATTTGDSRWISSPEARRLAHRLRAESDAIVVGIGTALADDPSLTVRHGISLPRGREGQPPLRVVMDGRARLPESSQLVQTCSEVPLLLLVGDQAPEAATAALRQAGATVAKIASTADGSRLCPAAAMDELASRGVQRVFLEGGARLMGSFFEADLVDQVTAIVAPIIVGGDAAPAPVRGGFAAQRIADAIRLDDVLIEVIGPDAVIRGNIRHRNTSSPGRANPEA